MKSNLKFSANLIVSSIILFSASVGAFAQENGRKEKKEKVEMQPKADKPRKATKAEKREIKLAQKKAAAKNEKRVRKIKGQ